jgi:hypothetical protein
MKNTLADLNNHLFAQLERLSDEDLTPEKIEIEAKRGAAVVAVADQIIRNASLKVQAAKILSDHGLDPSAHLAIDKPGNGKVVKLIESKKA